MGGGDSCLAINCFLGGEAVSTDVTIVLRTSINSGSIFDGSDHFKISCLPSGDSMSALLSSQDGQVRSGATSFPFSHLFLSHFRIIAPK